MSAIESLSQEQVQVLRSMFEMIDQDSDGLINAKDLASTFKSIGETHNASDTGLHKKMLAEVKGDLNFASFLKLMVSKQASFASGNDLTKSFKVFKAEDTKELEINMEEMSKNLLSTIDQKQIDEATKNYTKQDSMTGNKAFMAQRFINSIGI